MSEDKTPIEETIDEAEKETEESNISVGELKARDGGWVPLEDWVESGKEEADFSDIKEFNLKGEFFDKISSLNKQVKTLRSDNEKFKGHYDKLEKVAYDKALAALKKDKAKAMYDENFDEVVEVDERIKDLKDNKVEEKKDEVSEAYKAWIPDNEWYESDLDMQQEADALGVAHKRKNPEMEDLDLFNAVKKKMMVLYPDKFETKRNKETVSKVGSQKTVVTKKVGKSKLGRELTQEERDVARSFIKQELFGSYEEYADSLADIENA